MKSILYFVSAGRVLGIHKAAAEVIAKETGKRVSFRNATAAEQTGENPEPNLGVAGKVIPTRYADATRYGDDGQVVTDATKQEAPEGGKKPTGDLNAIGLPVGHPDNKPDLVKALKNAGVEFHGRAKTEVLVEVYSKHFFTEE